MCVCARACLFCLFALPPITISGIASANSTKPPPNSNQSSLTTGIAVGVTLAVLAVIFVIIVIIMVIFIVVIIRIRKNRSQEYVELPPDFNLFAFGAACVEPLSKKDKKFADENVRPLNDVSREGEG